jgi:DNA invertase Pin-like site-specific DNA recombinase
MRQRPGFAALLDYARQGDAIVVVGIDRLGRNAAEVMTTIRELGEHNIVLRSLREGIDTSNATGAWSPVCLPAWLSLNLS